MTPRIIPVGEEPPPMEGQAPSSNGRDRHQGENPDKPKRKTGERFGVLNAFVDVTMGDLRPAERSVWLILWRDTKPNGLATTSQANMARRAGISDRSVRSALRHLERLGLLTVAHRGNLRRGPSVYRVHPLRKQASG